MPYETDIPLTTVRSNASTGARKQGDGLNSSHDLESSPSSKDDEKNDYFRSGMKGRRPGQRPTRAVTDGEETSVNSMGRFYKKIIEFSIVTRYFVYVLPVALVLAAPIIYYAVQKPNAKLTTTGVRVYLFFLWIEIVWLSLWVTKLLSKAVPWLFIFLCGVVSSGTRKYAQVLRAVEMPLSLVGWAITSLVTFTALTGNRINNRNPEDNPRWILVMTNLLLPALFATILLLAEKMIIQIISIHYHRRSFDARIKESKHTIHLLGLLYDASRTLFPMYCPEFAEEDYVINATIESLLGKSIGPSGAATPLKLIGDIGRIGDKVTSVFGNIASEITGKQVFNPTSAHSIVIEALEKTRSSEALAKRLWMSFVVEGKESLSLDDIREVLGPSRADEAEEVFACIDSDGNGDISLEEMILKVVEIGRERKAIATSMRDIGQAIGVLDQILVTVLLVITIFIFVAFQNTNFVTTLATAGTAILSLSFVFAATTQEFLGSCIFLFVKHPFDVGDRVDITGPEKEYLVVEQISLLYTLFKRIDNMKMVQVPNIVLNNLWIENITRSNAMKEQLDMAISFDTSLEDLALLRSEMEAFVTHPDNARDFQPDLLLEATGVGNMDKLQLQIEIRHKSNWHNETIRAARRSKFMCALVLALRKIPINGPGGGGDALGGPSNPSYSVAINDDWAAQAREKSKKDKNEARFIPVPPKTDSDDALVGEAKAAEAINSRNPVADAAHLDAGWSSGRGDPTVHLPRTSEERDRTGEVGGLDGGLAHRKSSRGRRKAGDTIPPAEVQGQPALGVTAASPTRSGYGGRGVVDEEAELGLHQTNSTGPLYSRGYDSSEYVRQQQINRPTYLTYPPTQQSQPEGQGMQLHPLSSSPSGRQAPTGGQQGQGRQRDLTPGGRPGGGPAPPAQ
ncbi:uncharacterized protein BP5553_03749 [Venustampulla echinocandica]|uniref:EF-hand domain-containing protein n=1 Tax=Venustampulla echinocandica TaxID=2656787 RepID=A0A370TV77_9HELO|nr:uncharacterized protein BP5553_03749 [Venustampulla echinocandica]RDL39409.1 hypothetical protein BP5553_03749 [Venustampulla echinocandica]